MPTWREIRGAYGRGRRALRRAVLEPLLVGRPVLRDTVMHALAARGHFVFCDLGDAQFFVDPSDRVVGAWLMWHGGWQRREIDQAVAVLAASGRLPAGAVFVDVGANIGTHTVYALRTGRFERAVAFEPEPKNAKLLRMNIEDKRSYERRHGDCKGGGRARRDRDALPPPTQQGRTCDRRAAFRTTDWSESKCRWCGSRTRSANSPYRRDRSASSGSMPRAMSRRSSAGSAACSTRVCRSRSNSRRAVMNLTARRALVDFLAAHYTTLHSLNAAPDHRAPIAALADIGDMDDVLVF